MIFVGLMILFVLIMTWLYPYSIFSLHKTYYYNPDPVMVDGYVRDLNEFKESFESDMEGIYTEGTSDLTVDRAQYILPLFEQDWLVSKNTLKMKKADLEKMLFEVKNTIDTLMSLVKQVDYSSEQRQYLISSIENIISLEEFLTDLKTNSFDSRKSLRIQFHNLHGEFMSNFMMFTTFYEIVQDERLVN